MFDVVIIGKIVLEDKIIDGSIGVNDGKIAQIMNSTNKLKGKTICDYKDCYIFPGMIDSHVHCYTNPDEGLISTSISAAAGGITTFFDMPFDNPDPINSLERFEKKREMVEENAITNVALWATIQKHNGTDQIVSMAEAGAIAFKMSTFESDPVRFPRIPDSEIVKAMTELEKTGLRGAFHSENNEIIKSNISELKREGKTSPKMHVASRPPMTETSSVVKLLEFAYWTKAKLHIVHVSHPRTIQLLEYYKSQGVDVTSETCYPYLFMNVTDLEKLGPRAKCNPPVREKENMYGLVNLVINNSIDQLTSDHSPWGWNKKKIGKTDIFEALPGFSGVEILVPLIFDKLVSSGKISPIQMADLLSKHPAEIYNISNKGKIKEGYDADFTIINPNEKWTIRENKLHTNTKITPFDGVEVLGKVVGTVIGGEMVYDGKNILKEPGFGQFVAGSYSTK